MLLLEILKWSFRGAGWRPWFRFLNAVAGSLFLFTCWIYFCILFIVAGVVCELNSVKHSPRTSALKKTDRRDALAAAPGDRRRRSAPTPTGAAAMAPAAPPRGCRPGPAAFAVAYVAGEGCHWRRAGAGRGGPAQRGLRC